MTLTFEFVLDTSVERNQPARYLGQRLFISKVYTHPRERSTWTTNWSVRALQ